VLSPWRLVDYWEWTRKPDPNDFVMTAPGVDAASLAVPDPEHA